MRLVPHPTATFVHVQNAGVTSCAFFSASASFCRILKSFQGLLISLPLWVQSPRPSRSPSRQLGDSEQVTDASEPYSPCMKMQRKAKLLVTQSCLTPCDPMDCSLPGSSVQEILQARILGWGAIFSSRGSSLPRDQNCVCCGAGGFFTIWATRETEEDEWFMHSCDKRESSS